MDERGESRGHGSGVFRRPCRGRAWERGALLAIVLGTVLTVGAAASDEPPANPPTDLSEETPVRYVEVVDGEILGERLVWQEGPRTFRLSYETGRSSWTREGRLVLDERGLPSSLEVRGEIEPGVSWKETFELEGNTARWFTPVARGMTTVEGPAYYAAVNPPHDLGVLARALLRQPEGTLPLLPRGEARLETLGTRTVESDGEQRTIHLHAIHGLTLFPQYVWLSEDGSTFADRWAVLEGWEGAIPALRAEMLSAEMRSMRELAAAFLPAPRPRPLVIRNARLFDSVTGKVHEGMTVVVEGETIARIGEDDTVASPDGAELLDADGQMLLPGLWDMHAHLLVNRSTTWMVSAPLHLAAGVTTVRDVASDIEGLIRLRAAIDANEALGPHILPVGLIDGPDGERGENILVGTEEEVRAAVDRYAGLGYVGVKSYNDMPRELIPVFLARAAERGLYASGHPPFALTSGEAVEAGYDELHHLQMVFSAIPMSVEDAVALGETWASWYQVLAELTPDSATVRAFVDLLVEHEVAIDVTLLHFITESAPPAWIANDVDRLPAPLARALRHRRTGYAPLNPLARPGWERTRKNMMDLVPVLHEAGVPLTIGTDTFPGFGLYAEMALMVEAGLSPTDVLRLATHGAARVMGLDGTVGRIAAGQRADLILVDGDPTVDIDDIRRVSTVLKEGRILDPAAIHRALGIAPLPD